MKENGRQKSQLFSVKLGFFLTVWVSCACFWLFLFFQIQNEFILQRCLNFRLVPVLFPSANQVSLQKHNLFAMGMMRQNTYLKRKSYTYMKMAISLQSVAFSAESCSTVAAEHSSVPVAWRC